jgi:hypothetical protein
MITAREIIYGVYGAWRLAHLDPAGMQYFDRSLHGFWRSFWAAAVIAPAYALMVFMRIAERQTDGFTLRVLLIEIIAYAIGWTAFPLAAWYLLSALEKADRYFGYIVAYNWSNVLQVCVYVPLTLLEATDMLPTVVISLLGLAAVGAILYYQFFIARTALQVDVPVAIGLVFMDVMIAILLQGIVDAMEMSGAG